MIYIQLFADKAELLEPFDDAERGRLLTAMIAYAFHGQEPDLPGNERYIWPVFRQMIDASAAALEGKRKGGSSSRKKDDDMQTDVDTKEQKSAGRNTAEQDETEVSRTEQTLTEQSRTEQNGTEPDIIQESRTKNQELRTKNQEREGGEAPQPPSASRKRFAPPSPADVNAYAAEIGASHVDGERFCDFYASKGWRVGSQPMKDWRAAVRTWAKRDTASHPPNKPVKTVLEQQYTQRSYDNERSNRYLDAMIAEFMAEQEGGGP